MKNIIIAIMLMSSTCPIHTMVSNTTGEDQVYECADKIVSLLQQIPAGVGQEQQNYIDNARKVIIDNLNTLIDPDISKYIYYDRVARMRKIMETFESLDSISVNPPLFAEIFLQLKYNIVYMFELLRDSSSGIFRTPNIRLQAY